MHPTTIGPYQILRELGRGGMGEVFLAKDPRLDRQVAIKALPAHLSQDPDRLARFQREAKVLASLNHPGIGAIYGLEESGGHQYLILEYIEGETLADRLVSGAIPVDETLRIARQIAEALEVAHEKGIVHRDLKPGNVMVSADDAVKVLDFGLARTADGSPSSTGMSAPDPSANTAPIQSPTIPGAIMGTAGYMSPEQARGKAVDKRSDIFSFGCVLYEMLTGVGPFPGETATDSLGAILHREPDWALLPSATPARARELLRNCLAKDRRNRLHDIGDARLELERTIAGHEWTSPTQPPAAKKGGLVPVAAACAAAVLAGVGGWLLAGRFDHPAPLAPAQVFNVATTVQDKPSFNGLVGISPDSKFLVYTASPELAPESTKPEGVLMVRRLDRDESAVIEGTEGAMEGALSPDGRWIAYPCAKDRARTSISIKKVALENGRATGKPETVCDLPQGTWPYVCWASERELVFAMGWEPTVYAVAVSGGEPRVILREDLPKGIENLVEFRPLVAGKSILATRWSFVGQKIKANTEAIDLASGKKTVILTDAACAQYVPDREGGYLLATRPNQNSLIAVRFDPGAMHAIGDPVTVWSGNPVNAFRLSPSGVLAVSARSSDVSDRRLAWIDDKGQSQPIAGMTRSYGQIVLSPDSARVLATMDNSGAPDLTSDCWVQDLARRTSTRIPIQGALIGTVWSNDGQQIAYGVAIDGAFSIWERRIDGSGTPTKLFSGPDSRTLVIPTAWSPDGKALAIVQVDMSADNADVYLLEPDAGSGKWSSRPYLKAPASEDVAAFSPDGKWVLLRSSQSGRQELYVQRYTGDGEADARAGRVPVSTTGVNVAWWSQDGKEIRYLDMDSQVMSVQVNTEPTFTAKDPKPLYSIKDLKTRSAIFASDGRLMVVLQGESERTTKSVGIVVNFIDELRARMTPAK